eukprot:GHVT01039571.1.p1 GENE.GHVT01039571.1~~GHVT01039571.1.p1  ORF type:complete len:165 (+),score=6.99 GHVT01039571.1:352-846(+)
MMGTLSSRPRTIPTYSLLKSAYDRILLLSRRFRHNDRTGPTRPHPAVNSTSWPSEHRSQARTDTVDNNTPLYHDTLHSSASLPGIRPSRFTAWGNPQGSGAHLDDVLWAATPAAEAREIGLALFDDAVDKAYRNLAIRNTALAESFIGQVPSEANRFERLAHFL